MSKLFDAVAFGESRKPWAAKMEERIASYNEESVQNVSLTLRSTFVAYHPERKRLRIQVFNDSEHSELMLPHADLLADLSKERSFWVVKGRENRVESIREDALTAFRPRPNSPFALPFFGSGLLPPSTWFRTFDGVEQFLRPETLGHEFANESELGGWIKPEADLVVLRVSFNPGDELKLMKMTSYHVHDNLSYTNPDKTTQWMMRSSSGWDRFGEYVVPVSVEYVLRNGIPKKRDILETIAEIAWKYLKDDDHVILSEEHVKEESSSIESRVDFRREGKN